MKKSNHFPKTKSPAYGLDRQGQIFCSQSRNKMKNVNNSSRFARGVESAQCANPLPDMDILFSKDSENYHSIRLDKEEFDMILLALGMFIVACDNSDLTNCAIYVSQIVENAFLKGGKNV